MNDAAGQTSRPLDASIAAMSDRIVERFDSLRIVLFGSWARGDAGIDSDVDLLVVLRDAPDRRAAAVEIRRALADFPVAKDIVVTTPDEIEARGDLVGSVLRPALRDGRELYAQG